MSEISCFLIILRFLHWGFTNSGFVWWESNHVIGQSTAPAINVGPVSFATTPDDFLQRAAKKLRSLLE